MSIQGWRALRASGLAACLVALTALAGCGGGGGGGEEPAAAPTGFVSAVPAQATGNLVSQPGTAQALIDAATAAAFEATLSSAPAATFRAAAASAGVSSSSTRARPASVLAIGPTVCTTGSASLDADDAVLQRLGSNGSPMAGDRAALTFSSCAVEGGEFDGIPVPAVTLDGVIELQVLGYTTGDAGLPSLSARLTLFGFSVASGGQTFGPRSLQVEASFDSLGLRIGRLDTGTSLYLSVVTANTDSQIVIVGGTGRLTVAGQSGYFDFEFRNWTVDRTTGRAVSGSVVVRGANGVVQAEITAGTEAGTVVDFAG